MADEKRTSLSFSVVKSGQTLQQVVSLAEDLAGSEIAAVRQSIATSWTALDLGTITTADLLCVVNDSATNYVQLATASNDSGIFAKLTPGRCAFFAAEPTATYYARANTAACNVKITAAEA
jgi:hypothetical protein